MVNNQKGLGHHFLLIGGVVVLAIGLVGWRVSQKSSDSLQGSVKTAEQNKKAAPSATVDKTGAFRLEQTSAGNCKALTPTGWSKPTTNETSTTFDALSGDKSMYAGYGHQTISTNLAAYASVYPPPLNDPDLYSSDPAAVALAYSKIIIGNLGGDRAAGYSSETNEKIGDYNLRSLASSSHKGLVFFHSSGFAGDGINYNYSVPMYFAFAKTDAWKSNGLSLAKVSASINCTAQVVARSSGPDIDASGSSSRKDENGSASGYNPQLGTEYVYDPNTGGNYLVDPSRDWSSSGPNGGGYYKQSGNDYTQLQPGRSD